MDQVRCYYCGRAITNERDHVLKEVEYKAKGKKKSKIRDLHLECAAKYLKDYDVAFNEYNGTMDTYDKIYDKIDEFLDYRKCRDASNTSDDDRKKYRNNLKYIANRIKGLHIGKFTPSGENTVGRKTGYSYDVIYNTVLFSADQIRTALKNVNKKNHRHEVNLIFSIILKNIDEMEYRMIKQSNKNLTEKRIAMGEDVNPNAKINILTDDDMDRLRKRSKKNNEKDQFINDMVEIEKEIQEDSFDINDL